MQAHAGAACRLAIATHVLTLSLPSRSAPPCRWGLPYYSYAPDGIDSFYRIRGRMF